MYNMNDQRRSNLVLISILALSLLLTATTTSAAASIRPGQQRQFPKQRCRRSTSAASSSKSILLPTNILPSSSLSVASTSSPSAKRITQQGRRLPLTALTKNPPRTISSTPSPSPATTSTPLSIPQRLIAGGCSRGIAQFVLYPIDALRTLAQTRDSRTLADVGTKALLRGCATTSSFAVLIGSIQFAIYGATRSQCGPVLGAALGAAGSCLVSVPQEVIKQRLVTGVYSSFRNAVGTIYRTEGLRGFYSAWRLLLSRYRGATQIWIPRPKSQGGGYIDATHLPASGVSRQTSNGDKIEKAVMFCNPNAGLVEVSMGFSLISGNVSDPTSLVLEFSCWADYYLHHGYDVILFNYTGYGRSHAGNRKTKADLARGMHIFRRIFSSTFFGFKPSPASLKADATTTASHIIENLRVDKFLIHGESIGGMAASGAANVISNRKYVDSNSLPVTYPTLLICDRTFCNLNATAFRLVGSWTQYVIPLITPLWNTNVAGDFTSARCSKVVAQDASDMIIHDASSLKKGISTAKEFTKGETKGLGTFGDEPLTYRMADLENVGVRESKYAKFPSKMKLQAPVWPADKHINLPEAFHFAACARRIGKVATKIRKQKLLKSTENFEDEEEGIEITAVFSRDTDRQSLEANQNEDVNIILQIWDTLGLCDGLTGLPLGAAVKDGYDSTIDWLSGMVTLGSQRVVLVAEKRCKISQSKHVAFENVTVEEQDFEVSFEPYSDSSKTPPLPLPYVSQALQAVVESCNAISTDDNPIKIVQNELEYCIKMFQYIQDRISSKQSIVHALQVAHFKDTFDDFSTGRFLNLHCGHNNQYSDGERTELTAILTEAMESESSLA